MDFKYTLGTHIINKEKLIRYGFSFDSHSFHIQKDICDNQFYIVFTLNDKTFEGHVFDNFSNEEYLLINVQKNTGQFVSKMREEISPLVNEIVVNCFDEYDIVQDVVKMLKEKYHAVLETPWDDSPTSYTIKASSSSKWFGLLMQIPLKNLLGTSNELVNVLNIKVNPTELESILDNEHFFKAYHMNKKNWISILIDNIIDTQKLYDLIDKSYSLVNGNKDFDKRVWLVPANPNYFDIFEAFEKTEILNWKQGRGINKGDTVFIYVGSPISCIKYKCIVLDTDLDYSYSDDNLTMTKVMSLKRVAYYERHDLTFKLMCECGVTAIRGPRGITNELLEKIKELYPNSN